MVFLSISLLQILSQYTLPLHQYFGQTKETQLQILAREEKAIDCYNNASYLEIQWGETVVDKEHKQASREWIYP